MRSSLGLNLSPRPPFYIQDAVKLNGCLKKLTTNQFVKTMKISGTLAEKTKKQVDDWSDKGSIFAINSFIGDIYSGLQSSGFSVEDLSYADKVLWILSGLYGVIRPLDTISPYRLELAYKLPSQRYSNLYSFWGKKVATQLPETIPIVNLSSLEYSQLITPHIDASRIVTPKFLTIHAKTKKPTFVAVHAKIARGAFARWLIKSKNTDPQSFKKFKELGYSYDAQLSTSDSPVFVCTNFGGVGLSVRLA